MLSLLDAVGAGLMALLALPWLGAHLSLGRWLRRWHLGPVDAPTAGGVRIVVPARDEAADIGPCVEALRRIPGDDVEIVIVDDHSQDGTAEHAHRAAAGDRRISVRAAPERTAGWSGKAWACRAGADGETPWLLFVDADVRLDPRTPATLITAARAEGWDLASLFGTWEVGSPGERLLVPAFGWLVRGAVPMEAVHAGRVGFANGQCLLVRREVYEAVGGHEAVRGDVLDDVGLAEAVRRHGGRLGLRWAPWAFRLRPYRSVRDVLEGYRKNLFAGLDRRRVRAIGLAALLAAITVGPVLGLVVGAALSGAGTAVAGAVAASLQVLLRARLEGVDGRPPWIALLHPLAGALMAWTLLRSALGGSVRWKGRAFRDGRVVDAPDT